jgi:hypothetical protein
MFEETLFPITKCEQKLIKTIRDLQYGSIEVTIRNGQPKVVKKAVKTIDLESEE